MPSSFQELSNFIWSIAELLRGPYTPPQYERVMLPMIMLRRFDCVLAPTKAAVLKKWHSMSDAIAAKPDPILNKLAGGGVDIGFHNRSEFDFQRLKGEPEKIARHLTDYINGFSENVRTIFKHFGFETEIRNLEKAGRLYLIVSKFAEIDLDPDQIDNLSMGLVFEDLIRRFTEAANEISGEHFTPREVIRLMLNMLFAPDSLVFTAPEVVITVCDPACGTGGMLSEAQNWLLQYNASAHVHVYGQDINDHTVAVAASDLLIRGCTKSRIEHGDTLIDDKFPEKHFDYLLANPPFGLDWKRQHRKISEEHEAQGYQGRFGPKLPRVNDGALLFLLHMISKLPKDPELREYGSRCAIIFNGSPLFSGGAGSGESEIRRWLLENDWLETIVALPEQMFYNTGIGTFVWIVTQRKAEERRGKVQLIDARERWSLLRRNLGNKRRYFSDETIEELSREHGEFQSTPTCKIFDNADFGYRYIVIERPLRLCFQITEEAKEQFLDACPEFLEAVQAMELELGTDSYDDWNQAWAEILRITREAKVRWTVASKKLFRECFTTVDPEAQPVIAQRGNAAGVVGPQCFPGQELTAHPTRQELDAIFGIYPESTGEKGETVEYEPDPKLRDFENVPLKEHIVSYFLREVLPFVPDAWIDRETVDEKDHGIGKVGYEINFNLAFFRQQALPELDEINTRLENVERQILEMLQKVTA